MDANVDWNNLKYEMILKQQQQQQQGKWISVAQNKMFDVIIVTFQS